jgi:hypothetical protein
MRPSPGVAVTIYPCTRQAIDEAVKLLEELRPPIVQLHTGANDYALRAVRKALPGVRVWIGHGANGYAGSKSIDDARSLALWCADNNIELLVLNCEGDNDPRTTDWRIDSPTEAVELADRMARLLRAVSSVSPKLAIGFTSHDRVLSWPLPWGVALGPTSPVVVNADQVYPAESTDETRWITRKRALARLEGTNRQLGELVRRGTVRPDLGPGGAGRAVYTQLWGMTPAAVATLLDLTDLACAWALPRVPLGRAQDGGLRGLRLVLEARRRYGEGAGAILRAQRALGITADGIPGAETARALGV